MGKNSLQQNLDVAYEALIKQLKVDRSRLATLGHSMGSGAVMSAAINNVNRYAATVAISPTSASVTPKAPHNLQLQAGSWEGGFIANAKRLLESAGGENKNLSKQNKGVSHQNKKLNWSVTGEAARRKGFPRQLLQVGRAAQRTGSP
ncbi:hypothetical protein [Nostoc sp.]|uniref:hypothetical protein n=1 Tax=Nostoc sp. TaxID=1180 RepID=UPI002FF7E041